MDRYEMSANVLELSEHKTYIELTRRSCYYDYPNGNNVQLNSENALEKAETLINQPVVAKYKKIAGKDDLGGHECSVSRDGSVNFGTATIGVNTAVEVKNDDIQLYSGEKVTTPCLFVKSRIWKRNKEVCSAIKRLFESGQLHNSWEILTEKSEISNGVKILKDYIFESDCLLGSRTIPSFGDSATTLCMASLENPELLMAEALANDIYKNQEQEENNLKKNATQNVASDTIVETPTEAIAETGKENTPVDKATDGENDENSACNKEKEKAEDENLDKDKEDEEEPKKGTETSSLTSDQLHSKLSKVIRDKIRYSYVSMVFPIDKYCLVHTEECDELTFIKFPFEVTDDEVIVGEPENVKLVISVAQINSEIASKNDALVKANEEIQTLKAENKTLLSYKERCAKEDAEKAEKELSEKQEALKQYALKSNQITKAELETEEFKTMISELDEAKIKNIISDRLVNSLAKKESKVETSEIVVSEVAKANINTVDDVFDYKTIVKSFLRK